MSRRRRPTSCDPRSLRPLLIIRRWGVPRRGNEPAIEAVIDLEELERSGTPRTKVASLLRWMEEHGLVTLGPVDAFGTRVIGVSMRDVPDDATWGWHGRVTMPIPLDEIRSAAPLPQAPEPEEIIGMLMP